MRGEGEVGPRPKGEAEGGKEEEQKDRDRKRWGEERDGRKGRNTPVI